MHVARGKENPLLIAGGVPSGFLGEIIYRDLLPLENVERQGQRSCGALKYLVNKKLRVWYVQITTNRWRSLVLKRKLLGFIYGPGTTAVSVNLQLRSCVSGWRVDCCRQDSKTKWVLTTKSLTRNSCDLHNMYSVVLRATLKCYAATFTKYVHS